ncbi:transcription cofactor vestigial-like protein 1 [Alosa sapidissima]|uniref:transcription cofactor vestigial-like protein 1 n=1 Tax=Alosa sapidissima TaxID=34773 RepID=UPI001C083A45|nr:transcription cofactor vestigial-like protein 1 [Alosa sapidissima]XP_041930481.1 transcription cofactor vestigial-like protein 1 [Alosa sapidissima]
MEDLAGNPDVWKKEDGSNTVIYNYFECDINSMVDAHFIRALNKGKPSSNYRKGPVEDRQLECSSSLGPAGPHKTSHGALPTAVEPLTALPLSYGLTGETLDLLTGGPGQMVGVELPSLLYSLPEPVEDLDLMERNYGSSLLRVLHGDRPELGTVVVAGPKAGVIHSWAHNHLRTQQPNPDERHNSGRLYLPTD